MSSVMTNDEWANQGPEKPRGFVVKEAMMQQHYTERKTHVLKCSCRAAAIHKSSVLLVWLIVQTNYTSYRRRCKQSISVKIRLTLEPWRPPMKKGEWAKRKQDLISKRRQDGGVGGRSVEADQGSLWGRERFQARGSFQPVARCLLASSKSEIVLEENFATFNRFCLAEMIMRPSFKVSAKSQSC